MGAEFHDLSGLPGLYPFPLQIVLVVLAAGEEGVRKDLQSVSFLRVRWQLDGVYRHEGHFINL